MIEQIKQVPELLIPVGSPDKLIVAIEYGADAVYLGGHRYGLRYASENFSYSQLRYAAELCHKKNVKVFVVINSYFHQNDFDDFSKYVDFLNEIQVDALIVSDLGVISYLKENSQIPIHLSTQASCLNVESAKFWKNQGVSRIVLGREVSILDAARIKSEVDIEVEMFIHGSMCMAYSGQCTISNYTQGRDSNRGGCAHSCRFDYKLHENNDSFNNFFMSSKDLNGVSLLPEFMKYGIDSLKIEGRMKTIHYVGTVAKTYKQAIEHLTKYGLKNWSFKLENFQKELNKLNHRNYFEGSLDQSTIESHTFQNRESIDSPFQIIGKVVDIIKDKQIVIHCSHKFSQGDLLEIIPFQESNIIFELKETELLDALNTEILSTRPGQIVRIPFLANVKVNNLVRKIN